MLVESMNTRPNRSGFTFLEVLACLLVVGLGLASVVAMVYFGIVNSLKAQAGSTAMITAMSVAVDRSPYLSPDVASAWTTTPTLGYNMDDQVTALKETSQGYINGYLVVRTETSTQTDIIAMDSSIVYTRSVLVKVDVYALLNGAIVASYNTRFIRQRSTP